MKILDDIARLFEGRGAARYEMNLSTGVSQEQHALQCAALAVQAGAPDTLVGAALLHDVGHLLYEHDSQEKDGGRDDVHQYMALSFLRPYFPLSLLEPIKLHVDAKRYLCQVDPDYWYGLSVGSQRSLKLQGGPFSEAKGASFIALPFAPDAVSLRRWDDRAKDPGRTVPPFDTYRELLARISTRRLNPF